MEDSLHFWLSRLGWDGGQVEFSGFNQVFQELMAIDNTLMSGTSGVNVVLIRLENWARDQKADLKTVTITGAVREFIKVLQMFASRARRSTIVLLCPPSDAAINDLELTKTLKSLEREMCEACVGLNGISLLTAKDIAELYPVDVINDPQSDKRGEIPFTPLYWTAMGTIVMRKVRAILYPAHKVIAVDADNTLWGGVVAEAGAPNVRISDEWKMVQHFLLNQKQLGKLLAVVSKNREADVQEAFQRTEMILRPEDIVAWKANWTAKSENLRALASELELGLDSFIFLDDNPMECAEVSAHCPQVTVLNLPAGAPSVSSFLKHIWAFDADASKTTSADKSRTEQYRQQAERKQFESTANSYREFIEGLNLRVDFVPVGRQQLERASQLTQRTNQFNATVQRKTAAELAADLNSGHGSMMISVQDRFGHYGEVGLCVYSQHDDELRIENFLLSCRVLGKGVEHKMLAALGQAALDNDKKYVVIPFQRTDRNEPARKFLEMTGAAFWDGGVYRFPAAQASAMVFDPANTNGRVDEGAEEPRAKTRNDAPQIDYDEIARKLAQIADIHAAVRARRSSARPELASEYAAPRNPVEQTLAVIWADVLGMNRIGVHDNFFDLGGDSIMSIQIISRAHQSGLRFTLKQQFQYPTIAQLASVVERALDTHETAEAEEALQTAPLTAIQRWFFEKELPEPHHWNMDILVEMQNVSPDLMERAIEHLVEHHGVFRLRFRGDRTSWRQELEDKELNPILLRYDVSGLTAEAQNQEIRRLSAISQASLNLDRGPLARFAWFELGEHRPNLMLMVIHHLIVDGITWRIILEDIRALYEQLSGGQSVGLPRKSHSYLRWAQRARDYANSETLLGELPYWRDQNRGQTTGIPIDFPENRHKTTEATARVATTSLSGRETRSLLVDVPKAYQTQINDLLLTALMKTFHEWTGGRSFLIDLEGHGREGIIDGIDISRTAGWFTSIFPVSLRLDEPEDLGASLKSVKEQLRHIPNRGIGYGLLRYVNDKKEIRDSLANLPAADVMFNYLGQFDQVLPESGPFRMVKGNELCSPLHGPRGLRSHLIEIIGRVNQGELSLEWTFSDQVFLAATIEGLARKFGENLRALIRHCLTVEAVGATPSDYPLSKLGQKGLDQVMRQFAKSRK